VIELAATPPANELLREDELRGTQDVFPLDVFFCRNCCHVQLLDVVSPERLFRNYVYVSGTSPVFRRHFREYAKEIIDRYGLTPDSLVVDVGSNDGTLLACFQELGIRRVQGIDPATAIAAAASVAGIPTIGEFFTPELADRIVATVGAADVVVANNVFAHVDDLQEAMEGVWRLLAPGGVLVIEVSYLKDVIEKTLFDTIYHEHLDYHTVGPLQAFLDARGLRTIDAQVVDSHGGSLRLVAMKDGKPEDVRPSVAAMIERERQAGLFEARTFKAFEAKINALGDKLVRLLDEIKSQGKRIAAFGFPAKATTLTHQFKIDGRYIDYVVDDNPLKQSLYSPGYKIPIVPSQKLTNDTPDVIIVLAWNFADSIIKKLDWFIEKGGKVIVPLPDLRVLGG
jgi:SAM-dependent methyltransferase